MFEARSWYCWALLVVLPASLGCAASSAPHPATSVVWASPGHAYLGSHDRGALALGDSVAFVAGGRTLAAGLITSFAENDLATVTIGRGDLTSAKRLDHVSVQIHRRAVAAMDLLRIGLPSAKRGTALFRCASSSLNGPGPPEAFSVRDSGATTILTRDASVALYGQWPSRLEARRFDEIADEEIALERGEIDVAIFWPGELSSRLRKDPRWPALMGVWTKGVLAMEWTGYQNEILQAYATNVFTGFLEEALRGDLGPPPSRPGPSIDNFPLPPPRPDSASSVSFEVDRSCPGHAELQRDLDRLVPPSRSLVPVHRARLLCVDQLLTETRREPTGGLIHPLFTMGCRVVCRPELRGYVEVELGTHSLVSMINCHIESAKP
jgi:hypothetical protein